MTPLLPDWAIALGIVLTLAALGVVVMLACRESED